MNKKENPKNVTKKEDIIIKKWKNRTEIEKVIILILGFLVGYWILYFVLMFAVILGMPWPFGAMPWPFPWGSWPF